MSTSSVSLLKTKLRTKANIVMCSVWALKWWLGNWGSAPSFPLAFRFPCLCTCSSLGLNALLPALMCTRSWFFFSWDWVSLCRPEQLLTVDPLTSASKSLRLQVYSITPHLRTWISFFLPFFFYFWGFCFVCFWDCSLLMYPAWPRTYYVVQASLRMRANHLPMPPEGKD